MILENNRKLTSECKIKDYRSENLIFLRPKQELPIFGQHSKKKLSVQFYTQKTTNEIITTDFLSTLQFRNSSINKIQSTENLYQPGSINNLIKLSEENKIDIHQKRISGLNLLHATCREGNLKILQRDFSEAYLEARDTSGKTPLIQACIAKQEKIIQYLLRLNVRLNAVDYQGRSALHWSAYLGSVKITRSLLKKGAIISIRDNEGRTPLHLSTGNSHPNCLKLLLKYCTDMELNECDLEGMSPLHWAVNHNRSLNVQLLIQQKKIDLRATDVEGKTPLHLSYSQKISVDSNAAEDNMIGEKMQFLKKKCYNCSELLLKADPGMINISDLDGRTTLHQATGENNIQLVELLTSIEGVNINAQDSMKRTPLHRAAVAGYSTMLELLLSRNADDSLMDVGGATPLHYATSKNHSMCVTILMSSERRYPLVWAVAKGHVQTCRTLLDFNVNVSAKDKNGATALHAAAYAGQTKCATLLIERKADVNELDNDDRTPLFRACERGFVEMTSALIQAGANLKLIDKDGRSPLHWAATFGNLSVLSMLLANGAENDNGDALGKTPLNCAALNGHTKVVKFLLENGSNCNKSDAEGRSAIHWAAIMGHIKTLELLTQRKETCINKLDLKRCTALDYALLNEQKSLIQILVSSGGLIGNEAEIVYSSVIKRCFKRYKKNFKLKGEKINLKKKKKKLSKNVVGVGKKKKKVK
ncbi:hypothetical protein HK099_007943 [Clydaea vesicula]|uniref:Uncharacterized protein n=1 Tax=Clydaea vesicula TaxID=447962 RepID=A0AAD5U566_9FUNG|nr:hypothetical protein HK099_007943 [Clydaea vesicula]KAJ3384016.1 hypothetical protein HDU92_003802 [Lobulomyces angularis]